MKKRAAAATAATGKTTTTNMWNLDSFVDSTRPYKVRKRCDSVGAKEMHDVKREIENALAHRIGTGHAYYAIPFPSSLPLSVCVFSVRILVFRFALGFALAISRSTCVHQTPVCSWIPTIRVLWVCVGAPKPTQHTDELREHRVKQM